jgi:predicted DNA-binding protein (UPF0251 family)
MRKYGTGFTRSLEGMQRMKKTRITGENTNSQRAYELEEFECTLEAIELIASKDFLTRRIANAWARGMSRNQLAREMGTSRSQLSRLLDLADGKVTLRTLRRAGAWCAARLGQKLA